MLTRKGKYGPKAAIYLAHLPQGRWALIADIAARNMIPKKFLDGILHELKNTGLLLAKRGRHGGYMLARTASTITVGEVVRILDGPIELISCASRMRNDHCEDCPDKSACAIQMVMRQISAATSQIIDHLTLTDMAMMGRGMWDMMDHMQMKQMK